MNYIFILGIGCNIFLVLRLWCYALSAISRRLASAVAHLLYIIYSYLCKGLLGFFPFRAFVRVYHQLLKRSWIFWEIVQ